MRWNERKTLDERRDVEGIGTRDRTIDWGKISSIRENLARWIGGTETYPLIESAESNRSSRRVRSRNLANRKGRKSGIEIKYDAKIGLGGTKDGKLEETNYHVKEREQRRAKKKYLKNTHTKLKLNAGKKRHLITHFVNCRHGRRGEAFSSKRHKGRGG